MYDPLVYKTMTVRCESAPFCESAYEHIRGFGVLYNPKRDLRNTVLCRRIYCIDVVENPIRVAVDFVNRIAFGKGCVELLSDEVSEF